MGRGWRRSGEGRGEREVVTMGNHFHGRPSVSHLFGRQSVDEEPMPD
jgi:hypothetical protein